ncbi:quercetin 2,3-dioxygenase [Haladaptatus sp. DJG-WS-42]|uniref:quercetin 2,3-dioxygenase n=1 Tax=Haladaptatus sp. DJG-WS-42 TaxID=3120516 RepID=UPI0030D2F6F5
MSKTQALPPVVRTADEGDVYNILGGLALIKVTGSETGGAFGLVEQRSNAGMATPLHVHHQEDELFYVIDGQVTYHVDGEEITAPAGTTVFAPHGIPHAFRVDTDGTRWLDIRKGGGEAFFRDIGLDVDGLELPTVTPPTDEMLEKLNAHLEKYGVELLGPSPLVD